MDSSKSHDPFRPDSAEEATVTRSPNLARLSGAGATATEIEAIVADLAKLSPAATAVVVEWIRSAPIQAIARFVVDFRTSHSIEEAYNAAHAPERVPDAPESAPSADDGESEPEDAEEDESEPESPADSDDVEPGSAPVEE